MAFPVIQNCLICEEARPEVGRKLSLLGFYGITPNVTILVRDFDEQIQRLTFVFLAGVGTGKHRLTFAICDDRKEPVFTSQTNQYTDIDLSEFRGSDLHLVFSLTGASFVRPGEYTVNLSVDGEIEFRGRFELRQGKQKDFGSI